MVQLETAYLALYLQPPAQKSNTKEEHSAALISPGWEGGALNQQCWAPVALEEEGIAAFCDITKGFSTSLCILSHTF